MMFAQKMQILGLFLLVVGLVLLVYWLWGVLRVYLSPHRQFVEGEENEKAY